MVSRPRASNAVSWSEAIIVIVLLAALCAAGAVALGQDANWDQRNYHYYVVYALLNDRLAIDIAAAQVQSWFNPIGHLIPYWVINHFRPIVAGALLGAFAAVPLFLVYWLLRLSTLGSPRSPSRTLSALGTTVAGSGAVFVAELGSTFIDVACATFFLLALVIMRSAAVRASEHAGSAPRLASVLAAGLLVGAAAGVKLTHLAYVIAFGGALILTWPTLRNALVNGVSFGIAVIAGFAMTGGYWAYLLWQSYGNPVFPFYNAVFLSPWFPPENLVDQRVLPTSLTHALTYPFQALIEWRHPGAEVGYRDARYVALLGLFVMCVGTIALPRALPKVAALQRMRRWSESISRHDVFVLLLVLFSAIVLLKVFSVLRYLAVLELLAPMALLIMMRLIGGLLNRFVIIAYVALCATLVATTLPADWGRRPYGAEWFGIKPPPSVAEPGTLYLVLDKEPLGYTVASLSTRPGPVIALDNWFHIGFVGDPKSPWRQLAIEKIRAQSGQIVTLSLRAINDIDQQYLQELGLRIVAKECVTFAGNYGLLFSCRCEKL